MEGAAGGVVSTTMSLAAEADETARPAPPDVLAALVARQWRAWPRRGVDCPTDRVGYSPTLVRLAFRAGRVVTTVIYFDLHSPIAQMVAVTTNLIRWKQGRRSGGKNVLGAAAAVTNNAAGQYVLGRQ